MARTKESAVPANRIAGVNGVKKNGKEKPAETVELHQLRKRVMNVTIRGVSPLICHAWSTKAIRQIEDRQQKRGAPSKRIAKDPKEEFQSARYLDDKGRDCIPANGVKNCMVTAATSIDDRKAFPKTKIRQGLFVLGNMLVIKSDPPVMRTDMVRLENAGADVRYRPEYHNWSVEFQIEFNEAVFSAEQIINLLQIAGFGVGLCEWRPECDGNFGRFEVVTD